MLAESIKDIVFFAGFVFGISGSFHCVGMCGPLMLGLPFHKLSPQKKWMAILLYHVSRAFAYLILGLLIGSFGAIFNFTQLQQYISIAFGVLLIVFTFSQFILPKFRIPILSDLNDKLNQFVVQHMGNQMRQASGFSSFAMLGFLNGFLPCGLVYMALGAALFYANVPSSSLFMFAFGLGTIPMMMAVSYLGATMPIMQKLKRHSKPLMYIMLVLSFGLVIRGMNLGIPYLSPKFTQETKGALPSSSCCKKH